MIMKTTIFSGTKSRVFPLMLVFALMIFILSCSHLGTLSQIGAAVGQATGVISADTAAAIARTGEAWGRAFEDITPEQEYFIGRAVAANILGSYRIQTSNSALTIYVNKICNTLVINSPRPEIFNGYRVNILDTDEINAFATSGGHIFVTRGLVNCAGSEDALAAVIAHEIAHIQLQHGLKSIKNSRITQALIVTGTSAASAAGGYDLGELTSVFSESVGEIITTMVNNGYSQAQEFEADSVAMELLALAGYEPSSLLEMLRVLGQNQSSRSGGFNRTHPTPAQRISNVQRTVANFRVADTRSYRVPRFNEINY